MKKLQYHILTFIPYGLVIANYIVIRLSILISFALLPLTYILSQIYEKNNYSFYFYVLWSSLKLIIIGIILYNIVCRISFKIIYNIYFGHTQTAELNAILFNLKVKASDIIRQFVMRSLQFLCKFTKWLTVFLIILTALLTIIHDVIIIEQHKMKVTEEILSSVFKNIITFSLIPLFCGSFLYLVLTVISNTISRKYTKPVTDTNDINYYKKAGSSFDIMSGTDFEYFCAYLLEKVGYTQVQVTKASGDQGLDIIAFNDNMKYGFQCE